MRRKPPTIKSLAVNFHPVKGMRRMTRSTTALMGIPKTVPSEMKIGKVNAIPKLMKKLKTKPSIAELNTNAHGIGTAVRLSTPVKWRMRIMGQKATVLNNPRVLRKRPIWYTVASPNRNLMPLQLVTTFELQVPRYQIGH